MKWAIMLCGVVAAWLLDAWYFLILIGVLHSWWTQVPTMGWHTSLVVSGILVIGVIVSRLLGAFIKGATEDL